MSETWLTRHSWCTRQSWRSPTGMSFYPSGRMIEPSRVIVGHSTETTGFPGYNGGAAAPHFTIDLVSGLVRQHVPLEWGSRCLAVSTGGVTDRTVNITGTIQIEVIGAVTPGYPRTYGHYDLPNRFPTDERAQQHMARLLKAIHEATGRRIPLQVANVTWVDYPASYGVRARQRLSSAAFRAARGYLSHMHAPANDHGDGMLGKASNGRAPAIEKVLSMARGTAAPPVGDVTAPAGSTWEIDTTALNCRSGPGTQYQITGHAERGVTVTATGKASGPWIEAQTPWQRQNNVKAWWHSGFMRRVTTAPPPPKPDPQAHRAQELLHELGYDLGKHGVDGFWGPDSDLAARTYGADFGFTFSIPTPIPALLAHLEDTMAKIDDLLTEVRAIRAEQRTSTPAEIARAVWSQQLYGFAAHWQLRQGLITDPAHPNFPADPGSPADKVLRAEALESGRTTTYTPDGPVLLELDQDGRFQIKED